MTGGWDCHTHVFGPYATFPLAADRSYTPPEAPVNAYLAHLERLGLHHGVLVQPSAYGDDFSLLLDVLASHDQLRGVVVIRKDTTLELSSMRGKGVRAARFSHRSGAGANFAGSASMADLIALAPNLANAGLHAELWTDCQVLPDIASALSALPVPVVIDHMGGFDVHAGVDAPGFRSLLSLVESGRAWVKLCAYRNLLGVPDFELGRLFQQALQQAHPERLIWGSDWPHLRVHPNPDTASLLATFKAWTGSEAMVHQILQTNPEKLYS